MSVVAFRTAPLIGGISCLFFECLCYICSTGKCSKRWKFKYLGLAYVWVFTRHSEVGLIKQLINLAKYVWLVCLWWLVHLKKNSLWFRLQKNKYSLCHGDTSIYAVAFFPRKYILHPLATAQERWSPYWLLMINTVDFFVLVWSVEWERTADWGYRRSGRRSFQLLYFVYFLMHVSQRLDM